jgi:hypothetical protein
MLSGWAYARLIELLSSILSNRGIKLHQINPANSSIIGLVKYVRRQYCSDKLKSPSSPASPAPPAPPSQVKFF